MRKKIYYWASNTRKNSGEGILALKFLKLLKLKYKDYLLVSLNKFNQNDSFIYNYIIPFVGVLKLWIYRLNNKKICYVNYLPIWNFLLILLLPKKTILGPITGTNTKKSVFYLILKYFGIFILKFRRKKILFSHDQFKGYFKRNNNFFYNFLLFEFTLKKKLFKKKFDFVIYLRKNRNKGNDFLIRVILEISKKSKVAIIGDKFLILKKRTNIHNFVNLRREKSLEIIAQSRNAIASKENVLSFFTLDCLSRGLKIFYNKDLKLDKSIKTNLLVSIQFNNLDRSLKIINNNYSNLIKKKYFKFKKKNFIDYL